MAESDRILGERGDEIAWTGQGKQCHPVRDGRLRAGPRPLRRHGFPPGRRRAHRIGPRDEERPDGTSRAEEGWSGQARYLGTEDEILAQQGDRFGGSVADLVILLARR